MSVQNAASVVVDGAPNFRDLGGVEVAGGHVAPGRVFRSDALEQVTEAGLATLDALGVQVVCDLRTPDERARKPTRWPRDRGPEILDLAAGTDLPALRPERLRDLYSDPSGASAKRFMFELYREMPAAFGPALGQLAERIADRNGLPALVHCAAGRDRTGVVCSMLLMVLGAGREAVVAEHLRSSEDFSTLRLRDVVRGITGAEPPDPVVDAFRPDRDYLEAALDAAADLHGSIDGYMAAQGIDDARRGRLHDALVQKLG